jgi:hypothetical protein
MSANADSGRVIDPTQPSLGGVQVRCDHRWALLDPNEEDLRGDTAHRCRHEPGHADGHQCVCGARPEDD